VVLTVLGCAFATVVLVVLAGSAMEGDRLEF
jgi:hypothetical protein